MGQTIKARSENNVKSRSFHDEADLIIRFISTRKFFFALLSLSLSLHSPYRHPSCNFNVTHWSRYYSHYVSSNLSLIYYFYIILYRASCLLAHRACSRPHRWSLAFVLFIVKWNVDDCLTCAVCGSDCVASWSVAPVNGKRPCCRCCGWVVRDLYRPARPFCAREGRLLFLRALMYI